MKKIILLVAVLLGAWGIAAAQGPSVAVRTVTVLSSGANACRANSQYTEIVELRAGGASDGFYRCKNDQSGWMGPFVDAASAAPVNATYITQTPNTTLTAEQAMSLLGTGIVKNTTTTGVQSIITPGTGVETALAVNVGSAGAFVTFNGAGGTPSSITLTSGTGLPVSTGLTGAGTGVLTALGVNVGSAGAPVLFNGALGTPSSGTVTNLTGTASININGTVGATSQNSGQFTTVAASTTVTVTSANASALAVGRLGATTPALQVDASTATSITGIKIKSAASGGGVAISAIGEASNGNLTLDAQGSGTITIGGTSTGAITLTRATTMSAALTYGGVALSNAVTGTGNMVLSAGPTFTGTVTIPTPFTIGAVSMTSTGTQLNYLNAATGTTGTTSTNVVFSTSPTLVTPTLGVATSTRLGIGTAAAAASGLNLSVSASNVQAALIYNTNATDGYGLDVSTAANDATRYSLIVRGNANRADFQILSNATINLNTTSYNTCTALTTTAGVLGCTVSDPRVKNSIRPFQENALDIISKIHPITFQFNKGTPWYKGRTELGFNARNLMNADSLLASETGNASGSFLQPEQLAIQALEMAGINELRERVDRLEKEKLNEKTTRNRRPVRRHRHR